MSTLSSANFTDRNILDVYISLPRALHAVRSAPVGLVSGHRLYDIHACLCIDGELDRFPRSRDIRD